MEYAKLLRDYGLFDARVPRYTSFPPASRFVSDVGRENQKNWIKAVDPSAPVSIYVHIPFCRRLCWFCACRTQGTQTLDPVDAYLDDVVTEIQTVAKTLRGRNEMARLHLGGGTPTLLVPGQMARLLRAIFDGFDPAEQFEFSVEIDPTEAEDAILDELARWGMHRASIGVQDFDPKVQEAIGRPQSFEETERVICKLHDAGVKSVNIDLLYGLPHQTSDSLMRTLDRVASLRPDRLALYGYAHVPHMSKRQVMIPSDALPTSEERYLASRMAEDQLSKLGYLSIGIDHFALAHDSLAHAAAMKTMRRNFQGYTDDPCDVLLGFGASAISTFPQGFSQNAPATATYRQRIQSDGLAAHKGYVQTEADRFLSHVIGGLMCNGAIDMSALAVAHPGQVAEIDRIVCSLAATYPEAIALDRGLLRIRPRFESVTRLMAAHIDQDRSAAHIHSLAI